MFKNNLYIKYGIRSLSTSCIFYADRKTTDNYRDSGSTSPNSGETTPKGVSVNSGSDSDTSTPNADSFADAKEIKVKLDYIEKEKVLYKIKNKEELTPEELTAYESLKEEFSSHFEDKSPENAIKEIRNQNMSELRGFFTISSLERLNLKRDRDLESESDKITTFNNKKTKKEDEEIKSDYTERGKNILSNTENNSDSTGTKSDNLITKNETENSNNLARNITRDDNLPVNSDNLGGGVGFISVLNSSNWNWLSKLLFGNNLDSSISNIDYVLEKQSLEMPDIYEADGNGD